MALRRSLSIREKKGGGVFRSKTSTTRGLAELFGQQVKFIEDYYSSVLEAECNGKRFKGIYHPPEMARDAEGAEIPLSSGTAELPGLAVVEASVEQTGGAFGALSIVGQWKHVDSTWCTEQTMATGVFEMYAVAPMSTKEFRGWWQLDDQDEIHPWKWTKHDTRDTATRLIESPWMDRWGMLCAWLFFVQTSLQLLSLSCDWDPSLHAGLNQACNVVYSISYTSFLVAYGMSSSAKNWLYISGVALYTVGYFIFAGIYSGIEGGGVLYHTGSWLFLIGSVLLMASSTPKGSKGCLHTYSPHRIQTAIWWGSTMFLLGSCCFAVDALELGEPFVNGVAGLSFFDMGRAFFVRGSQTKHCTWIFLGAEAWYSSAPATREKGRKVQDSMVEAEVCGLPSYPSLDLPKSIKSGLTVSIDACTEAAEYEASASTITPSSCRAFLSPSRASLWSEDPEGSQSPAAERRYLAVMG